VKKIVVPRSNHGKDYLSWSKSSDGTFSSKSAYEVLSKQVMSLDQVLFKLANKWKGTERIKSFLWKLSQMYLLEKVQFFAVKLDLHPHSKSIKTYKPIASSKQLNENKVDIKWKFPDFGDVALNCDGAVNDGGGGFRANLKAILVGVKLAWSRGFTRIRVVLMHPCYNVVQGIHEVHSGSGNIIWNNILKEANQVDLQRKP